MSEIKKEDNHDLADFGYKQELDRSLGSFSSFAAGFSYISILTGMFQLFFLGFAFGGPAFFWAWPIVFFGKSGHAISRGFGSDLFNHDAGLNLGSAR